jgi:hypothetical protein
MRQTETKFCKDCMWYVESDSCQAPQNQRQLVHSNLVTGGGRPVYGYRWFTYDILRSDGWLVARFLHLCGKEGRWWRKKEGARVYDFKR